MRSFLLRARAAPTNSVSLLAGVGNEAHTEIIAHTLMNALFIAQSHREDVAVYLVLEESRDFAERDFLGMRIAHHAVNLVNVVEY